MMTAVTAEEMLTEARAIAAKLKRADKEAFGQIFSWLYKHVKRGTDAALILETMQAGEKWFRLFRQKPAHLHRYFDGALRKIREEHSRRSVARAGGGDPMATFGDVLKGMKR